MRRFDRKNHRTANRQITRNVRPANSTCYKGRRPTLLIRNLPDFKAIKSQPGMLNYAFLSHDIDAEGRIININLLGSSGNEILNTAAQTAMSSNQYSTFFNPARTGCVNSYSTISPQPIAYPSPDHKSAKFRNCEGLSEEWVKPPKITYPANFNRRRIEGWAELQFDVAPWGQISNVSILRAQPSQSIGLSAKRVLASSKKPSSDRGYTGCTEFIRFQIEKSSTEKPVETTD